MHCLTILYGHPDDPAAFDRYYEERHLPVAAGMRGLTAWRITRFQAAPDGTPPPFHSCVELCAPTRRDLQAVLDSDAGRAASADVANFADGGVQYVWGELRSVPLW